MTEKAARGISVKVRVDTDELDKAIEKVRELGELVEPVYVVYLNGLYRLDDMLEKKKHIEEQLDGTVLIVDGSVNRIEQLSPTDRSRLVEVLAGELEAI